jgi:hypothetical protein
MEIPLHNYLVVGSYGTLLDLFLFQILLFLSLHLCSQFDLLTLHCIEASYYTAQGYTVVVCYYTEVVQCYIVVV